ncbi:hypothetical protein LIER_13159 [Lithospermum erythrorhizon]|uniref:Uncharacterized protein n=1 Tax=Lithospermum erythrorhizon TaxID=34254 RepID=A0AAV3PWM7_LITER
MITPEVVNEKAAPASGDGAGAITCWAEVVATAANATATKWFGEEFSCIKYEDVGQLEIAVDNGSIRRAKAEHSRDAPMITPEVVNEKAAPASGDGAGAITCWAEVVATAANATATKVSFFTMLT